MDAWARSLQWRSQMLERPSLGLTSRWRTCARREDRIAASGGSFRALAADVMHVDTVRQVLDRTWQEVGPVQHFVHVVGGTHTDEWFTLDKYPDDLFDRVFSFNLRPLFQTYREVGSSDDHHFYPGHNREFRVDVGYARGPLHGPYGAAKSAVISLTKTMAVEWGPYGIRVNAVAPGQTETTRTSSYQVLGSDPTWNPLQRGAHVSDGRRPDVVDLLLQFGDLRVVEFALEPGDRFRARLGHWLVIPVPAAGVKRVP